MTQDVNTLADTAAKALDEYFDGGNNPQADLTSATAVFLGVIQGRYQRLNNKRGAKAVESAHRRFMDMYYGDDHDR